MALTPPPVAPPAAPPAPGDAPSRANPSTFRELADAFVVWQVGFRDWLAGMVTWLAGYITWASANVTEMDALQTDVTSKSSAATTAASSAATSAASVQANRTALDNRLYPGTYSADPVTRPDGSAVQAGDRYFNSSIARQKTYSGTVWATDNLDAAALAASGGSTLIGWLQAGIGAVQRLLQDKLREVQVSVTDFGADPTGVADSLSAIHKARDAVALLGGGTVTFPIGHFVVSSPIVPKSGVHFVGAGKTGTLVENNRSPYDFVLSSVLRPGNFHPTFTQNWYGSAEAKAINTTAPGAVAVTLTAAGDAAGFSIGDPVWIFTAGFYTSGAGQKIPEYGALARVLDKSGANLTLDRGLSVAVTGSIVNLRTTAVASANGDPLAAYMDGSIRNLSVKTPGYWVSDSAMHNVLIENVHVLASRAVFYGNTVQNTVYRGVTGKFAITAGELSHNSENVVVEKFAMSCDTTLGTPVYALSVQENGRNITFRDGTLALAGFTGGQSILRWVNATGCRYEDLTMYGDNGFAGQALLVGDIAASGRVPCTKNVATGLKWQGPTGRFVFISGDTSTMLNRIVDNEFYGTSSVGEAARINVCTSRNAVDRNYFADGRLALGPGVTDQSVRQNHFGLSGALALLTASDETLWRSNLIEANSSPDSYLRQALNFTKTSSPSLTASEVNFCDSPIGTNTLRLLDRIEVCLRGNITGTTAIKTVTVKFFNGTTDVDLFDWVIPAATVGAVFFKGTIAYMADNNIVCTGYAVGAGVATYFNNVITSGITGNPLTFRISGFLGNAADSLQLREITSRLTSPVIK